MNRILLLCSLLMGAAFAQAQTTYYWVGGAPSSPQAINVLTNWNTLLNGTGTPRVSNISADILVFDGTNYGGATTTIGIDSVNNAAGITCAQIKFVNGAKIVFTRGTSGTSTMTIAGDGTPSEDFVIESGCSLTLANGPGSQVLNMGATGNSGRVSGDFAMITGLQARIANGTATTVTLTFTPGSTFTTNITSAAAAYAFGNASQSTEKWVTFQSGSTCYYDGGYSVQGSSSAFQPVNFLPGSQLVVRASNPVGSGGTFVNRKAFANVVIQNNSTFTADGPISRIDTLTIASGSSLVLHSSGTSTVLGNLVVEGSLTAPVASTNELQLAGNVPQTITGSGTIALPSLAVMDSAQVTLGRSVAVSRTATVFGRLDFGTHQLTGAGSFFVRGGSINYNSPGNTTAGAYFIAGVSTTSNFARGLTIQGAGIQQGTRITGLNSGLDTVYISRPATATATGVSLTASWSPATLVTSNPAGFDPTNGSIVVADQKIYTTSINYVVNAPTTTPFGISTGSAGAISVNNVQLNAAVTTNTTAYVSGRFEATAGKVTIRPLDTLAMLNSATLVGTYNASNYLVTDVSGANAGVLRRDGISGSSLFPIGTATHYLPVTLNPASASDFAVNVFQGITNNGTPNGTPLSSLQKQTVVDAVWNVARVNGSGDANLKLQWTLALEGTTLATFANSEIGIIRNTGTTWSLPFGTGDNTVNTADTVFNTFGQFSVGARPPANPFVFNPLPAKTYGDADFSPGVISSNTTSPITYTSSNTAVATIVGNNIHITGVGTTTITAQQASDGFYPAANVSQTLTVNKAPLTIKADRKIKPEGDPNPPLTATYTGFVLGETQSVLLTPAVLSTTATTASPAGSYLITVSGATAANYAITFVNDSMIVRPRSAQTITLTANTATRTYGAADFAIGATSSNTTIPLQYSSSNTAVATVVGSNVRIVGAGTAIITVTQPGSDLFFPATPATLTVTVNKAPLTIRAADTTRNFGEANPTFRLIYSGFVLGETPAVFNPQPSVATTATTNSAPGYYALTPGGAGSNNYNITYVDGRLTILPTTGTAQPNLQAFLSNSTTLTVRVYSPEPDLGDVLVFDSKGKLVARRNVFLAQGFITTTLSAANMPSGIYVVKVVGKQTDLRIRISIIH